MHIRTPLLPAYLAALGLLCGCNFSSPWGSSSSGTAYGAASLTGGVGSTTGSGGGNGKSPPGGVGAESGTAGTDDTVLATASTDSVSTAVGSSQTLSITFASSDGLAITGFGISGTLGALPAGWNGPNEFTCKLVMAGSGCVLNLTYTPTAVDSGSLVVDYVYVDNALLSKAPGGSVAIAYQAVAQNNAVATAQPSGQINAVLGGGSQAVSVTFTSDSSNGVIDQALTALAVTTDLTALPAGWSSASPAFSCAIVTTGNGCELMLRYAPGAAARGVLTLNYTYADDTGAARSGTLDIPYSTTSSNNVVATAAPAGQVEAAEQTGSQSVMVGFTTDDGKAASGLLLTSSLTALPAGWHSAASSFECGSVGTGNGCTLALSYAPTALGSGTLALTYAYTDDAGNQQTGSLNVPYTATADDNVVATVSPAGQIDAVVGQGTQGVTVQFATDDTRLATALEVTTGLSTLPAGWSAPATFQCITVSTGGTCRLALSYAPGAYTPPDTLALGYSYANNAGQTKTGTVNIPYRAMSDDTVLAAVSPASPISTASGSSTTVTVGFTTSDGNPATALSLSAVGPIPAGVSLPGSMSCGSVDGASTCQIVLTYAPTFPGGGTLRLDYGYTNDAQQPGSGSLSIQFDAT